MVLRKEEAKQLGDGGDDVGVTSGSFMGQLEIR